MTEQNINSLHLICLHLCTQQVRTIRKLYLNLVNWYWFWTLHRTTCFVIASSTATYILESWLHPK